MVSAEVDRHVISKVAFYFPFSFFGEMQYGCMSLLSKGGSKESCKVLPLVWSYTICVGQ
jgi:hypothetical protein